MQVRMRRKAVGSLLFIIGIFIYYTPKGTVVENKDNFTPKRQKIYETITKMNEEVVSVKISRGNLENHVSFLERTVEWKKSVPKIFIDRSHEFYKDRPDPHCENQFHERFRDNLKVVQNYEFSEIDDYLKFLNIDERGIQNLTSYRGLETVTSSKDKRLVIVTGTSSNHFGEFQGLVKNLRQTVFKQYKNVKFVFYNLGLQKSQLERTKKYCDCEVRSFSIKKLPPHVVRPNNYAWKPVLLQLALQDFDRIVYLDTSFRFNVTNKLDKYLDRAEKFGFQMPFDIRPVSTMTDVRTFSFLKEDPCPFYQYPEAAAQIFIIDRSDFTMRAIMKPLVSCALQFGCMAHPKELSLLGCKFEKLMHACHRFDQSVLGIILTRLFNVRRDLVTIDLPELGAVIREDKAQIFPFS